MRTNFLFTSESVTEGHPDKLCDQISDAIVDSFLQHDPYSRVIAECAVSTGILFIATRFASVAKPEIPEVARQVVEQVGYTQAVFSARDCTIMNTLQELPLSAYAPQDEMDMDDTQIEHLTPRNSATVFGYACDETPSLMPLPISLAHRLTRRLSSVRHQRLIPYLAPDGQSQIGIEYRDWRPARVHSIMLMVSQLEETAPSMDRLHRDLVEQVIEPVFEFEPVKPDRSTQMWINPYGPVILGGPALHGGFNRSQECRRYLRRLFAQQRIGAEWQGSQPHRPGRGVCGAPCREERGGRRTGHRVRGPVELHDWARPAGQSADRNLWHRPRR